MIVNANSLRIPLADASVQMVVTSPPYYGLRDYGIGGQLGMEETPEAYIGNLVCVFQEVWRVLKSDGVVFLNLGDSYSGAGRGEGGKGIHSLKQTTNRGAYYDSNNLDRRAITDNGLPGKNLMMIPARVAIALQADGWYIRAEIVWAKKNCMPESVKDRPSRSHEMIYLLSKSARYYYDNEAVKEPIASSSVERAEYGWNGRTDDMSNGARTGSTFKKMAEGSKTMGTIPDDGWRNQRDVWNIATESYSGAHYATFPTEIPRRAILAGSKAGDIVLDPFCGSGTTGEVCRELGRRFVGLDLSMKYLLENALPRAERKTAAHTLLTLPMFAEAAQHAPNTTGGAV